MSTRARVAGAFVGVLLLGGVGQGCAPASLRAQRALERAQALADRGKADDALDLLYSLLETNPNYPEANLLFIRLRRHTGHDVVAKEYERKLKADPESALFYFFLGYANTDPAAQARYYRKAVDLDPDLALAQLELGRLCRSKALDDLAASRQALDTAAGLRPDWAEAHLELARTLAAMGQMPDAIAAYRRTLELDRACEAGWFELACLQSRAAPGDTEATLAEGARCCPSSGRLWWHLADFQWTRRAWSEAADSLERALAVGPDAPYAPEARNRLASCYLSRGWHRRACRLGDTAWSDAADEMAAGRLPAEAFRLLREADEASGAQQAESLRQAAHLAPKSLVIQRGLADALLASGLFAPAAAAYAQALAGRPGDAGLRRRAAEAELLAGRPARALATLGADRRRLAEADAWLIADAESLAADKLPLDALVARHAAAQATAKKPEERLGRLRACIEKFPAYLTPRLELAYLLREAGDAPGARAVLDAAAGLKGHPLAEADLQMQLGDLDFAAKDTDKAIEHYKAAIERCPEPARQHGALARAAVAKGDFGLACEALTRQLVLAPQSYDVPAPSQAPDAAGVANSGRAGGEPGTVLLPRLVPGDVLRYRYSTDGGQPGRQLARMEFDLVVEGVGPGHLVESTLEIIGVSGRIVEGGTDFVGARLPVKCSSCFGLVAADAPPRGVPSEFADLLWLVQLLYGPALPTPRWPGQKWQATAWTPLARPFAGEMTLEKAEGGTARLTLGIRYEKTASDPTADLDQVAAAGRAAVAFDLTRKLVERVEATVRETLTNRRGDRAEPPPRMHRLELLRAERGARRTLSGRAP